MMRKRAVRDGEYTARGDVIASALTPRSFYISLIVNGVLFSLFFYTLYIHPPSRIVLETIHPSVQDSVKIIDQGDIASYNIDKYVDMSDEELLFLAFSEPQPLFFGVSSTDLSFSLLFSRGYTVDIPLKRVQKWPQEIIKIPFQDRNGDQRSLMCFSSLGEDEKRIVQSYLRCEKIPYTTEKLYTLLKRDNQQELKEALYRSQEWHDIEYMLRDIFTTHEKLWQYLSLFSWDGVLDHIRVSHMIQSHPSSHHLHAKTRQKIILQIIARDFIRTHSPNLARCIIMSGDPSLFMTAPFSFFPALFQAIPKEDVKPALAFAVALIKCPIHDLIFQSTKKYIAAQVPDFQNSSMSREEFILTLERVAGKVHNSSRRNIEPTMVVCSDTSQKKQSKEIPVSFDAQKNPSAVRRSFLSSYTVKKGDTLWSISRAFDVQIDKIRYLNRIQGNSLPPGKVLKIPKQQ